MEERKGSEWDGLTLHLLAAHVIEAPCARFVLPFLTDLSFAFTAVFRHLPSLLSGIPSLFRTVNTTVILIVYHVDVNGPDSSGVVVLYPV